MLVPGCGFSVKISGGLESGLRLEAASGVRRDASAGMDGGVGVGSFSGVFSVRSLRCMPNVSGSWNNK